MNAAEQQNSFIFGKNERERERGRERRKKIFFMFRIMQVVLCNFRIFLLLLAGCLAIIMRIYSRFLRKTSKLLLKFLFRKCQPKERKKVLYFKCYRF